jgi:hypothetical protein
LKVEIENKKKIELEGNIYMNWWNKKQLKRFDYSKGFIRSGQNVGIGEFGELWIIDLDFFIKLCYCDILCMWF